MQHFFGSIAARLRYSIVVGFINVCPRTSRGSPRENLQPTRHPTDGVRHFAKVGMAWIRLRHVVTIPTTGFHQSHQARNLTASFDLDVRTRMALAVPATAAKLHRHSSGSTALSSS